MVNWRRFLGRNEDRQWQTVLAGVPLVMGLETGMSVAQVQQLLPDARSPVRPGKFRGARERLVLNEQRFADRDCSIGLVFAGDALLNVQIRFREPSHSTAGDVAVALTLKHGEAAESTAARGRSTSVTFWRLADGREMTLLCCYGDYVNLIIAARSQDSFSL